MAGMDMSVPMVLELDLDMEGIILVDMSGYDGYGYAGPKYT